MGKQNKQAKKVVLDVLENDEFPIGNDEPVAEKKNVSMKKLMDEVINIKTQQPTPILSEFKKPLQKKLKDNKEKPEKKKKIAKPNPDKSFKYINNVELQKQLKSLTMRGVAKIMNMISQYHKTHPQEQ